MDKYEYRMKTEQMLAYIDEKAYVKAMKIADTIDWRRVKNTVILCATSEVYEHNGKFDKSRDVLFIAYDRAPDNKKIIYKLGILALKQGDLSEAMDCYDEFVTVAPKDPNQYILRYKILKLQNSSVLLQIEAMKTFKALEYTERWVYELAKLYDEAGMLSECLAECDDLILWFRDGEYLKETLELKRKHHAMTGAQESLYLELTTGGVYSRGVASHYGEQAYDMGYDQGSSYVQAPSYQEEPVYNESMEHDGVSYVEPMYQDPLTTMENYSEEVSVGKPGDTKIIGQEDMDKINSIAGTITPDTIQLDTKAIMEAESTGAKPFKVRGASVSVPVPTVSNVAAAAGAAAGVAAGVAAASTLGSVLPTKIRDVAVSPDTTGQLRIDEILTGWEEKQRAVEEAIAIEKAKGLEKAAKEAKLREEEKIRKEAKVEEKTPELPDDIRKMIQDIEGGTNLEPEIPEEKPVVAGVEESAAIESFVEDAPLYIEEEFHDNIFEAEEEYDEYTEQAEAVMPKEVTYEEPVEDMVPVAIAIDEENLPYEAPLRTAEVEEETIMEEPSIEEPLIEEISIEEPEQAVHEQGIEEYEDIEAILARGDEQVAKPAIPEVAPISIEAQQQSQMAYETMSSLDTLEEHTPISRIDAAKAVATGRTVKLPTEEIMKAAAASGSSYDTGFIVQARYDLDAQSQIGLRAGLTEEQKKLFSYFVPVRGMSEQLVEVLEKDKMCIGREGSSCTGNLLIVGRKGSGKTVLAVDVVKAIQKNRGMANGKVAIVTGEALNKKKISDIVGKLYGGALIIEKASLMNEKTITRLNKAMERETGEILVVLEDERKPLDSVLATNLEFRRRFTSRLEVPVFINDELVTFGQAYAKENGYKIDEMGILALYSRIDMVQKDDYSVTVADVKDIIDEAIESSLKGGVKKLAKKLFKRDETEDAKIILTEKYFNI